MPASDVDVSDTAEILLVEDNPGDVRLVIEGFEATPLQPSVHVVTNGDEALDFLFQRGEYGDAPRPDLVLLDLNLPRTNGEDVLAELKRDPDRRRIPVLVLTSSRAEADVIAAYDHHANVYLTKPVSATEFIETISQVAELWFSLARLPAGEA